MSDPLEVVDLGDRRRVVVSNGGQMTSFETALSADIVCQVFAIKGAQWVKDAIDRTEDPEYLERPVKRLIKNANPANESPDTSATGLRWTIVISAGPDGILQTDPTAFAVSAPSPAVDDIVARVK